MAKDSETVECPLCALAIDGDYKAGLALMQGNHSKYWMKNQIAASKMLKEQVQLNIEQSDHIYELEEEIAKLNKE